MSDIIHGAGLQTHWQLGGDTICDAFVKPLLRPWKETVGNWDIMLPSSGYQDTVISRCPVWCFLARKASCIPHHNSIVWKATETAALLRKYGWTEIFHVLKLVIVHINLWFRINGPSFPGMLQCEVVCPLASVNPYSQISPYHQISTVFLLPVQSLSKVLRLQRPWQMGKALSHLYAF